MSLYTLYHYWGLFAIYLPEIELQGKTQNSFANKERTDIHHENRSTIREGALYAMGHSIREPFVAVVVWIPCISRLNFSAVNAYFASVLLQARPAPCGVENSIAAHRKTALPSITGKQSGLFIYWSIRWLFHQ